MLAFLKRLFAPPFRLPEEYKDLVYEVATGNKSLTSQALKEHRKLMDQHDYTYTPEYGFMKELTTPMPDLAAKIYYRRLLIKAKPKTMLYRN